MNANCAGCTRTISTVRHGTEQNKADLTVCGENTLLARETHLIGIRFKNDTERLERLFELYTKMTAAKAKSPSPPPSPRRGEAAKAKLPGKTKRVDIEKVGNLT